VLNLTHRDGHEHPSALEPGHTYQVPVTLNACGHRFAAGHRIRLAVGSAYWPLIWPAPYPATLTIRTGSSRLDLPVRRRGHAVPVAFEPSVHGPLTPVTKIDPGLVRRVSAQDHVTGENSYVTEGIGGVFGEGVLRFDEVDVQIAHSLKRELMIRDDDPLSARYVLTQSYEMGREGWRTRVDTRAVMRSDRDRFYIAGTLTVTLNGQPVAQREWDHVLGRDLM
jgi:hypothetical protein